MNKFYLPLLALALALAGCKSDKPDVEPVMHGFDYYPLAVGDYSIYMVTEVAQIGDTSQGNFQSDTTIYYLRETIDTVFADLQNEEIFRIFRHRRNTPSANWQEDSVITVKKTQGRLERTVSNNRQIKLVFPMSKGRSWDTNMLNSSPFRELTYTRVDVPYTLRRPAGDTLFANTTLVSAPTDSSGIHLVKSTERYAKNAGMIESVYQNVYYDDLLIGSGIIEQADYRIIKLLRRGRVQ